MMQKDQQQTLEQTIAQKTDFLQNHFNSPISAMLDLSDLVKKIEQHLKSQHKLKDEVKLNLFLWNDFLEKCTDHIDENCRPNDKLCVYLIERAYYLLTKIDLNPTFFEKYKAEIHNFGLKIGYNDKLMRTAIFHGFDVNWLIQTQLPDDLNISADYKELKQKGYLDPYSPLLGH